MISFYNTIVQYGQIVLTIFQIGQTKGITIEQSLFDRYSKIDFYRYRLIENCVICRQCNDTKHKKEHGNILVLLRSLLSFTVSCNSAEKTSSYSLMDILFHPFI